MGPSRPAGGLVHSTSSSGIFFHGDGQSQALGNFHFGSLGNFTNSALGNMRSNMGPVGDVSNTVMNSVASSGPSVGASSLVTDANSGLSGGGPRLQRSASINTESYMRLPASPLSFSSNNVSISGSSIIDGPSAVQQNSNQDPLSHQAQPQGPCQGASASMPLPPPRLSQVSLPNGSTPLRSFNPDQDNITHLQKKPRLDMKQEDIMQQQQVFQQIMQRQDSMQMQTSNPQLQALIQQQQRLRQHQQQQQQQQLLQSLPPAQRAHLLQQQQQLQLRQIQQQGLQPAAALKRPLDGGVCSRRLMQYLYHQRQRPADNAIAYWRKFVVEYYSPRAKKRWCLSLYDNVGHHSLGVFPQASMDAWQCDICGSKSGRGFEATFDVLPRLNEIKFGSGVIDELLFLDLPRECRFSSGVMMLEYAKAVQESVYEQLRVVREGQLRIVFTPDLKILTWEFCARRHEELLPRRLVAPQVNQLLQVAQKCQSTIAESGPDGVSQQDLQANSNMVVAAGRQLAKSLELQSLNDLGFSKRYVRSLQIAEVVNSMKELIDFCTETKVGAIEGLKGFPRAKLQMQKTQEMDNMPRLQGLPTDQTALSKLVGAPSSVSNQSALTLSSYQNMLMRQNSMNSNPHQEASSLNTSNQNTSVQGWGVQNNSNPHLRSLNGMFQAQQNQQNLPSQGSGGSQQCMIQQLLEDVNNNNSGAGAGGGGGPPKPSLSSQSVASSMRYGSVTSAGNSPQPHGNGPAGPATRSNSFKAASHSDSSAGIKAPDASNFPVDALQDIASQFTENGFFSNDELDDAMGFGWKA